MPEDLLYIPPILRRSVGDAPPPRPTSERHWIMPDPKPSPKKVRKAGPDESLQLILATLGWTDTIIKRLTAEDAESIIAGGKLMTPADEIQYGRKP